MRVPLVLDDLALGIRCSFLGDSATSSTSEGQSNSQRASQQSYLIIEASAQCIWPTPDKQATPRSTLSFR